MTASLKFEFALDAAETVRASQAIEKRARSVRLQAVLMLLFAAPITMGIVRGASSRFYAAYFSVLVVIILFSRIWPTIRERQVRKFYDAAPALRGIQRYEFADDGLALTNDHASNLVRWTAFTQAVETPEFFLLYYSPKCAYYLPKRIVANESQTDAVREFLREKLGPKADHLVAPT
jgi:drug/metabolite transporter superfamily protein YnfA